MAKRWDDPFRTGFAGQYDPGTMYGLIYRARAGDLAAKNHLSLAGFYDQQGNDIYGGNQNYQQAVTNWAKAKNLGVYGGPDAFQWNSAWAAPGSDTASPFFSSAWDSFWTDQPGQAKVDQPQDNKPNNPLGTTGNGQAGADGTLTGYNPANDPIRNGSYNRLLAGKFDPWGNWGRYGPRQNGVKKHQTAQGLESDVDRVYRWTNDQLRGMGYSGGEDPRAASVRTKIFLDNVERLKSEYAAEKARNPKAPGWETSDFYNMDQQLAADGTPVDATPAGNNGTPPPTTPATGQGTGQTGTGGQQGTGQTQTYTNPITGQTVTGQGNDFARNLILASDSDARNDYLLRALGIDPQNGGLYLDSILRTISPMAGRFIQLQGIGGDTSAGPVINTQGNLDTLAGWLRNPGGMANVQNWARGQLAGATAPGSGLSRLSDANAQLDTIGQLLAMQYSGVNPILVQAYADYFDRSRRGYRDYNFNQIGRGSIQNPIDWLRSSQWADLLG